MQTRKLSICMLLYAITAGTLGCDPAEEGKPYDFRFSIAKLPKESTLAMWTKDDILVAECPVDTGDCTTNDMNWLSAKVEKNNEVVTFYIHIYSVSRMIAQNAKGLWKLRTHTSNPNVEVFYHCNLQIYAKPKDISCDLNWLTESLNVECRVTRLFPEAMMIVNKTNTQFGPISCVNHRLPEEIAYYNATCSTQFLHQQLHLKTDLFQFFIYPNLISFSGNRNIGINASATLYSVPTNVVLKQCGINKEKINCSCKSLNKKVLQFSWFVHNNKVDNIHDFYITNIQASTEQDIVCKTVIQAEYDNVTIDCDNTAVTVLAILLVIAIVIVILSLVLFLLRRHKRVRHALRVIRDTFNKSARQNTMQEHAVLGTLHELRSREEDITTAFLPLGTPECQVTESLYTLLPGVSGTQAIKTKNVVSKNIHKVTTTILLIGTRNSNKELLKRTILQREYCIINIQEHNKKQIVDEKNIVIIEISKPKFRDFPNFSLPDEDKIQLHYTKHDDHVIKLVDGPVYDTNNIKKFIEDMKSCLSLSQEGFNAIIVALTLDRAKDCNSLINMLHGHFGLNVNNLISVIIYEIELKIGKSVEGDYSLVKNVCGDRLLTYNIENHIEEIKELISLVTQMELKCSGQPLCIKNDRSLQYSELEEILKDICLMLKMVLDDSQTLNGGTKELVDLLVMLWRKHQDFTKEEIDTDEDDQTKKDKFNSNSKHNIKMDNSIIEDVTHLIECFRIIYSVDEPMRRCKEILMPSFKTSYQNFHDWYVISVIKDKENLLDSNFKMRLLNLIKK